jgi:hypothetical protein
MSETLILKTPPELPQKFTIDGNEHEKGAGCWCSPKPCPKGCGGYFHQQAVYHVCFTYLCDKCQLMGMT